LHGVHEMVLTNRLPDRGRFFCAESGSRWQERCGQSADGCLFQLSGLEAVHVDRVDIVAQLCGRFCSRGRIDQGESFEREVADWRIVSCQRGDQVSFDPGEGRRPARGDTGYCPVGAPFERLLDKKRRKQRGELLDQLRNTISSRNCGAQCARQSRYPCERLRRQQCRSPRSPARRSTVRR